MIISLLFFSFIWIRPRNQIINSIIYHFLSVLWFSKIGNNINFGKKKSSFHSIKISSKTNKIVVFAHVSNVFGLWHLISGAIIIVKKFKLNSQWTTPFTIYRRSIHLHTCTMYIVHNISASNCLCLFHFDSFYGASVEISHFTVVLWTFTHKIEKYKNPNDVLAGNHRFWPFSNRKFSKQKP